MTDSCAWAISLKQPWATLLVTGTKTVEVRRWSTRRTGSFYIHASKVEDARPEAWRWITNDYLLALTNFRGGILGAGELTGCLAYDTQEAFAADRGRHLNEPDWYVPAGLYGLTFRRLRRVPFVPCPGQTFFFRVEGLPPP